jgi:hypothetical protein
MHANFRNVARSECLLCPLVVFHLSLGQQDPQQTPKQTRALTKRVKSLAIHGSQARYWCACAMKRFTLSCAVHDIDHAMGLCERVNDRAFPLHVACTSSERGLWNKNSDTRHEEVRKMDDTLLFHSLSSGPPPHDPTAAAATALTN